MTKLVPIKEGQWVLAFPQPYGLYDEKTIEQHLEQFSRRGGGWDTHRKEEIFAVLQVEKVMPQTYTPANGSRFISKGERQYRFNVIAAGDSEAEMIALRDRLYAIGDEVDDRIEAEMYRRIEKFAAREQEKGLKRVKRLLPHIYGRDA